MERGERGEEEEGKHEGEEEEEEARRVMQRESVTNFGSSFLH